ncbi:MAG: alpha-mannosidase, partial [Ruthenibacterium lactatiformans]
MGCWQRFQDKTLTDDVLQCYGYGDGGGGPTAEMLELQRRLAYGIPGAPRTRQSTSLAFFEELERRLAGQDVPCWCGEFYFEYHRGVFTTMARNKRYNRLAEFKNADAELFSALNLACGTAHAYPAEALAHNWELTLLNQFHDILPGSSIEKVYEDSMEQYEQVLASDAALIG